MESRDEDADGRLERRHRVDDGLGPASPAAAHLVTERGAREGLRLLLARPSRQLGDGRPAPSQDEVRAAAAVAPHGRLGRFEADGSSAGRAGRRQPHGHRGQAFGTARVSTGARAPGEERATRAVT